MAQVLSRRYTGSGDREWQARNPRELQLKAFAVMHLARSDVERAKAEDRNIIKTEGVKEEGWNIAWRNPYTVPSTIRFPRILTKENHRATRERNETRDEPFLSHTWGFPVF